MGCPYPIEWHLPLICLRCQIRTCKVLFPKVDSNQLLQVYHCLSILSRRAVIVEWQNFIYLSSLLFALSSFIFSDSHGRFTPSEWRHVVVKLSFWAIIFFRFSRRLMPPQNDEKIIAWESRKSYTLPSRSREKPTCVGLKFKIRFGYWQQ